MSNKHHTQEHYVANARREALPDGDELLNACAVFVDFEVSEDYFRERQRNGWPALGYKPLPSEERRLPFYGRTERMFRRSMVKKVLEWTPYVNSGDGPGWLDAGSYRHVARHGDKNPSGLYRTLDSFSRAHEIPEASCKRWAKNPCRYLTDANGRRRTIHTLEVKPPTKRAHEKVCVYFDADGSTIHGQRDKRGKPNARVEIDKGKRGRRWVGAEIHRDEQGEWLTDSQMQHREGVGDGWCYSYADRASILRPGQKALRSKRIPNPNPQKGSPGEVRVFLHADARLILQGKETKRVGVGTGKVADALRDDRNQHAKEVVARILAAGPRRAGDVMAEARAEGITPIFARRAFKLLRGILYAVKRKGKPGVDYWWRLPDGQRKQGAAATGNGRRGRPNALDRHRQWKAEHDAGKSLAWIAKKWKVTRGAVVAGIRKERARALNSQPE